LEELEKTCLKISFAKYPKHLLLFWIYYNVRKEREGFIRTYEKETQN
jgi:hypothetical protein